MTHRSRVTTYRAVFLIWNKVRSERMRSRTTHFIALFDDWSVKTEKHNIAVVFRKDIITAFRYVTSLLFQCFQICGALRGHKDSVSVNLGVSHQTSNDRVGYFSGPYETNLCVREFDFSFSAALLFRPRRRRCKTQKYWTIHCVRFWILCYLMILWY